MNQSTSWSDAMGAAFTRVAESLVQYLPSLLGAVVLLLVGWLVARLLRAIAVRGIGLLDLLLHRLVRGRAREAPELPAHSVEVVGTVLFWLVILFFVAAATEVLGLDVFSSWLRQLVVYLPTLLAGGLIILAGFLLAGLARDLVLAALAGTPQPQRVLFARLAQGSILITAVVVGADQIGIRVTFLVIMAAVALSAVVGGVAIAFSLGARSYISNLIGVHYLRQSYGIGQTLRLGGFEGKILEFTPVAVVLEVADGRVTLPGKLFNEEPSVLMLPPGGNG